MTTPTSSFQRILIATDFSDSTEKLLQHGYWLGETTQATVTVAHVITDMREAYLKLPYEARSELLSGDIDEFERALRGESQLRLDQLVDSFGDQQVAVKSEVLLGRPDLAITRAVIQEKYDLVLCGTEGKSGVRRLIVGSTAQRLVRICPSSVWVVKQESVCPPMRILAAVDFSETSRLVLEKAGCLAANADAHLDIVHVVDVSELPAFSVEKIDKFNMGRRIHDEVHARLERWSEDLELSAEQRTIHVLWGTPWQEIADRSRQWGCDLIVMGTAGRRGLPGFLLGNTAEKTLHHCDCSLFTVKSPEFVSPVPEPFWELHPAENVASPEGGTSVSEK